MNVVDRHAFWSARVRGGGTAPSVSTPAVAMMKRENRLVRRVLRDTVGTNGHVLDVGCANGYSTHCWSRGCTFRVTAIDKSAEMVEVACSHYGMNAIVADMTALPFPDGTFDAVVIKRALCNLESHAQQDLAIRECFRVTRLNGIVIVVDFCEEGYRDLHYWRSRCGLEEDVAPRHNLPLRCETLLRLPSAYRLRLAGWCYIVGFVMYPYLCNVLRLGRPRHTCWINRLAARMPSPPLFGPLEMIVSRKAQKVHANS